MPIPKVQVIKNSAPMPEFSRTFMQTLRNESNVYISKQANVRIKHADTEGSSHKKFGTDARVQ